MSDVGLIIVGSGFSVSETVDRLTAAVTSRGLTVFARIDHAANAAQVQMPLRPTQLLIFGDPRAGTPLMQDRQTVGIDLPLRTVVWEDPDGKCVDDLRRPALAGHQARARAPKRERGRGDRGRHAGDPHGVDRRPAALSTGRRVGPFDADAALAAVALPLRLRQKGPA